MSSAEPFTKSAFKKSESNLLRELFANLQESYAQTINAKSEGANTLPRPVLSDVGGFCYHRFNCRNVALATHSHPS